MCPGHENNHERPYDWLLHFGKDPEKTDGYAKATVQNRASRMDQFYRWVWDEEDAYTAKHRQANYIKYIKLTNSNSV